jgi:hypothetical protein
VALLVVATVVTAAVVVPVSEPDHSLEPCLALYATYFLLALSAAELLSFCTEEITCTLFASLALFCYVVFFVLRYEVSV